MTKAILPFTLLQAFILLLFITVTLVFFLFKRITKPVSDLIEQCSQVANGNDSIEIESSADTELDKLASAFNGYRKKLEAAAYSDFMLGIGTRQKYLRDAEYLISNSKVSRFSLFMVDIVEFGKYNDVFLGILPECTNLMEVGENLHHL